MKLYELLSKLPTQQEVVIKDKVGYNIVTACANQPILKFIESEPVDYIKSVEGKMLIFLENYQCDIFAVFDDKE